ncbi:MAG: Ig-like domain-containing protein, partial [Lachnospiraceae bacterium]|nr:Ig-like domain-containing protein [Lachnospiraceae bacterium]
ATTLTVKATSTEDPTKSGTSNVTVTEIPKPLPTVTSVTVTPASAKIKKGNNKIFSAIVIGTNNPAKTVIWKVTGNKSARTSIDSQGLLTVGRGETAGKLMVTATSTADSTKSGNAAIKLINSNDNTKTETKVDSTSRETMSPSIPRIIGNSAKEWEYIVKNLDNKMHGSMTVDMKGGTVVPKEIFKSLKGKDITLTLIMQEGVEWIIKGTDIPEESQFSDFDFGVMLNKGNIPMKLIKKQIGTKNQGLLMSLNHEGNFGFRATLCINLSSVNAERFANLLYYNEGKKILEAQSIGLIDKTGKVLLEFSHASDYVILIDQGETLKKMAKQITVSPSKKVLYMSGSKAKTVNLTTKIPQLLQNTIDNGACNYSIKYKSSNPKVATISSKGQVKALSVGNTVITTDITINGVTRSFKTAVVVKKTWIY